MYHSRICGSTEAHVGGPVRDTFVTPQTQNHKGHGGNPTETNCQSLVFCGFLKVSVDGRRSSLSPGCFRLWWCLRGFFWGLLAVSWVVKNCELSFPRFLRGSCEESHQVRCEKTRRVTSTSRFRYPPCGHNTKTNMYVFLLLSHAFGWWLRSGTSDSMPEVSHTCIES